MTTPTEPTGMVFPLLQKDLTNQYRNDRDSMKDQVKIMAPAQFRRTYLRNWRKYRKLSIDALVDRLEALGTGISRASLSRMENGRQLYTQTTLEALAAALECEPYDILMRDPLDEDWGAIEVFRRLDDDHRRQIAAIIRAFAASQP